MVLRRALPLSLVFGVVIGVVAVSGGCGEGLESTFIARERFPAAYAQALCTSLQHCCNENAVTFDYAACTRGWKASVATRFTDEGAGSSRHYDPKRATSCVELVKSAEGVTCAPAPGSISDARDTCQSIFAGTAALGEPCTNTSDCAPIKGSVVQCALVASNAGDGGILPLDVPLSVPRCVRARPAAAGDPCSQDGVLGSCNGDDDRLYCNSTTGTCQTRSDIGGPCTPGTSGWCAVGAFCVGNGPSAGVCAAAFPLGRPCTSAEECDSTGRCDVGGSQTCIPLKDAGEPCVSGRECSGGACDATSGKCLRNTIATTAACTGVGP